MTVKNDYWQLLMRTKQNFTKFLPSKVSSLINLSARSSWNTTIGPKKIPFMSALESATGT